MSILSSLLKLVHIFGVALAVGTGTAKLVLLLKCKAEPAFLPSYLRLSKTITRLIIVGIMMLALSGAGWLLLGYPLTSRLVVKIALVAAILVLGPIIDNVTEPRFRKLAP